MIGTPVSCARRSGPSGIAPGAPNSLDGARRHSGRDAVHLERDDPPFAEVPQEGERGEGVAADVDDADAALRRSTRVDDLARPRVALRLHDDHHATMLLAREERPHALPPGGVRRREDGAAAGREDGVDDGVRVNEHVRCSRVLRAGREQLRQAGRIRRERPRDVGHATEEADLAAHAIELDADAIARGRHQDRHEDAEERRSDADEPAGRVGRAELGEASPEQTVDGEAARGRCRGGQRERRGRRRGERERLELPLAKRRGTEGLLAHRRFT